MNILSVIMDFIDTHAIVRRIAFFVMLWITVKTSFWTLDFAWNSGRPGMDVAAILAAIWAPLSALQGAMFKFYDSGRNAVTQATPGATQ